MVAFVSKEFIKELDELFPERCPSKTDSDRDIWINVGRREMINFIKAAYQNQEKRRSDTIVS